MGSRDILLRANNKNKQNDTLPKENLIDDIVNETPIKEEPVIEPIPEPISEPKVESIIERVPEPVVESVKPTPTYHTPDIEIKSRKKRVKSKAFTIRLYPDIFDALEEMSKEYELSLNDTINQVLAHVFEIDIDF